MLTDLLSGRIQAGIDALPNSLPHIRSGSVRALAIMSAKRTPALPDVPSINETIAGLDVTPWTAVGVPSGTPVEIVERLNREINAGLNDPGIKRRLAEVGGVPLIYTPGELRALVAKLRPDVLAVELPTNVPDAWQFAAPDLTRVTKPWAEKHHVPMVPIGSFEPNYEAELAQMSAAFNARGKTAAYDKIEREFQYRTTKQSLSCRFLNSEAYRQLMRGYQFALHQLYGRDTPWETWNLQIYRNVMDMCRRHPGKRIVVVLGAPHASFLIDALRHSGEVQLVPVEQEFPLSSEEIARQTLPTDYLQALRMLNFETLPSKELPRLSKLLDEIAGVPELSGEYHLFKGKLLMHSGQFDAAQREFDIVAKLDPGIVSAIGAESEPESGDTASGAAIGPSRPLREFGLVYGAIAKQRSGDQAGAEADLQAIANAESTSDATKKWAARVLSNIDK